VVSLVLVAAAGSVGCGGGSASPTSPPNPVPSTSAIIPSTVVAGSTGFTLTVTGSNFIRSSVVNWNGTSRGTTFVSATELRAAILTSDVGTAGTAAVTVFNPAPGGGTSNAQTFNILAGTNPVPTTSALEPSSGVAGGAGFVLIVHGGNFVGNSVVRWNGADRITVFESTSVLTAAIPPSDIATAGTAQVTVFNPMPGGGTSNAQTFTISAANPVPTTSGLNPSSRTAEGPGFTLTVNGTNFIGSSAVRWNGANRTTTFVSGTQLTAAIPASDIATPGTAQVTVVNPAPGGGTSNTQTFTIEPTLDGQIGRWSEPLLLNGSGMVAVHMALMRTGQVLVLDGPPAEHGGRSAVLWTPPQIGQPGSGSFISVPNPSSNMFCGGHSFLADGKLLVVGGHVDNFVGIADANLFDVQPAPAWSMAADMEFRRWYPTATTLADGRVLVLSGAIDGPESNVMTPEIYDPATRVWTSLNSADTVFLPLYPFAFVLPDGRVLQAGSDEATTATRVLNVNAPSPTWTTIDPDDTHQGGSAAMYLPGKVIKAGSAGDVDIPSVLSVADTFVLTVALNETSVRWRPTAPMSFPRAYHNLTLLPDGNVLVTGGGRNTGGGVDPSLPVLEAELWSPQTERWTTMASMQRSRQYHSTALLLPDGRVAVAGSGRFGTAPNELTTEIYSPGYLFRGPRPTITSVSPSAPGYGNSFTVNTPDASRITAVTLVRPGAVTHGYDQNQRFLNLIFTAPGALSVTAPANANLAPPGYYMLFIVNTSGVPSVASFIHLP
jgi:hypothetical protein